MPAYHSLTSASPDHRHNPDDSARSSACALDPKRPRRPAHAQNDLICAVNRVQYGSAASAHIEPSLLLMSRILAGFL